jgi:hypothetical protein
VQGAVRSSSFDQSTARRAALLQSAREIMSTTIADVFELIEPADPDSIRPLRAKDEFLLNWLEGGFTPEQLSSLRGNENIVVLDEPYKPDEPAITHQMRIKVL